MVAKKKAAKKKQKKHDWISGTALGKKLGVTRQAVSKAVKDGRFVNGVRYTPKGRPQFHSDIAPKEWESNRVQPQVTNTGKAVGDDAGEAQPAELPLSATPQSRAGASVAYNNARAVRENFEAKMAKLRYEKEAGLLIPTSYVKTHNFTRSKILKEMVLGMPDRVASAIAAKLGKKIDPVIIHNAMDEELRNVLEEVANQHAANIPAG